MASNIPPIIDDETADSLLVHPRYGLTNMGRGLELPPEGFRGYEGVAEPFPDELLIPRSEYQARIEEKQARKATIRHRLDAAGIGVKDQNGTNYCWINAPTFCVEITRMNQGLKHVELSPASAGAQMKNFRNVGGWGKEGLEWIVKNGVAPTGLWPANAINRQYATAATKAEALKYRVDEWWVLEPGNNDQIAACVLRDIPVAVGYSWWGHEVTVVGCLWLDGALAWLIANSWAKTWGDNGYGTIQGRRMAADDAVAPRTAIAA